MYLVYSISQVTEVQLFIFSSILTEPELPRNCGLKPPLIKGKKRSESGAFRRMGWRGFPLLQSRSEVRHIIDQEKRKFFL